MKLNGKDPTTLHRCISLSGEKLPGSAERDVVTVESDGGEQVVRVSLRALGFFVKSFLLLLFSLQAQEL